MDENQEPKKISVAEIRKTHPRMGMRWSKEEDDKLRKLYTDFKEHPVESFDVFISRISQEFGRAIGGMKARLALYFPDVPGWDYDRDRYRVEELNKKLESVFTSENIELLRKAYEQYLQEKLETYSAFAKRMAAALEISEAKYITQQLIKLFGSVTKYSRQDVRPVLSRTHKRTETSPEVDFSTNPQSQEALYVMNETKENLFLTGEAGTGKSTLLQYFRYITEKNVVVLAPTGVAALNVEGQTIHSFCGFGPDITLQKVKKLSNWSPKQKLLRKLHAIVIDEISMVRADLLDCVEKFLRLNGPVPGTSFGGVQMIFIGDLYQLPPVEKDFRGGEGLIKEYSSPYFFDSRAFKEAQFKHIQLQHIYRQRDQVFIDLLNAVRNNVVTQNHLEILNTRAGEDSDSFTFEKFAIYLTPTNLRARQVNNFFLERLRTPLQIYEGTAVGTFADRELPTDLSLQIKVGSQVMMLNNDSRRRWVNGTMGKIVGIEPADQQSRPVKTSRNVAERLAEEFSYHEKIEKIHNEPVDLERLGFLDKIPAYEDAPRKESDSILVELETGEVVSVLPHTWEMFKFVLDAKTESIESQTTGTFTQYPFKLAWAVTIHKAQGKTFNKVYIDLATGTFAHGQLYVALSRCRTLEGLYLKRPVTHKDIILDPRILDFLNPGRSL